PGPLMAAGFPGCHLELDLVQVFVIGALDGRGIGGHDEPSFAGEVSGAGGAGTLMVHQSSDPRCFGDPVLSLSRGFLFENGYFGRATSPSGTLRIPGHTR